MNRNISILPLKWHRLSGVLLLLLFYFTAGLSQEPVEVTRSKNKVLLNGKQYYLHVVKKGQTLFSISQAYNVSQKEVAEENPGVMMGLKEGETLKIPFKDEIIQDNMIKSDEYEYHIFKEGQTLYYLSKLYDVPLEALFEHNPEIQYSNIQIDQVIKIPITQARDTIKQPAEAYDYFFYRVKQGETLYSLAKRYDITVEGIRAINESLRYAADPKAGQVIKIPKPEKKAMQVMPPTNDTLRLDTSWHYNDSLLMMKRRIKEYCDSLQITDEDRTYRVALLLPLYIDHDIDMDNNSDLHDQGLYEFYEGVLLALGRLKALGLSIDMHVYDTGNNPKKVADILSDMRTKRVDLIIGPFYTDLLKQTSDFSRFNRIPLVSPLSTQTDVLNANPYLFQVTPSSGTQMDYALEYVSNFHQENIILVHSGDSIRYDFIQSVKTRLLRQISMNNVFDDAVIREVVLNENGIQSLRHALSTEKENVIIIASDEEVYVTDAIRQIYMQRSKYDIRLVGHPAWHRYRNIEIEYLHALDYHYYTPYFIDYEDEEVISFLREFKSAFEFEPYKIASSGYNLAFLGYDIMYFFGKALHTYGSNFTKCAEFLEGDLLLSKYKFFKVDERSGFENQAITIIEYTPDFEVRPVDYLPASDPTFKEQPMPFLKDSTKTYQQR